MTPAWLSITRGNAPLLVSIPHTGTDLVGHEARLTSPWIARRDADWWIDKLYAFAAELGATIVHTSISRTIIDVNRDPSGVSLYPGQATTTLCPTDTFDGDPLYRPGHEPNEAEISARRTTWFDPYANALRDELKRLRGMHDNVVIYDCHSIRSVLPRLFDGELPEFNLGTNDGKSADRELQERVIALLAKSGRSWVANGRFKGGWITRHHGDPANGVHALQMELACRGYMREPEDKSTPDNWPTPYDPDYAAPMQAQLKEILTTAIRWAERG